MWNFILLLLALFLWAISLFLVAEAAKSQKWALGGDGLPDPYSGVGMSQFLSFLFVLLWAARVFLMSQPQDPFHFLSQLLVKPDQLTAGILLAVFPPVVVGLVKLVRSEEHTSELQSRGLISY